MTHETIKTRILRSVKSCWSSTRLARGKFDVLVISVASVVCLGLTATAQNISLGKQYAYFKKVPGQSGAHYKDDGPINGLHVVHTTGLGMYGLGNLTDGAVSSVANGGLVTTHLAIYSGGLGIPVQAADIIFDLGGQFIVTDMVIGTVISAGSNNNAPDDVTVSYSTTGTAPGDFGSPKFYDMEAMYGPLTNGHHDMPLGGTGAAAKYVKFAFDGGSMAEPGGQDPDEKYMFDEITINGFAAGGMAVSAPFGAGCTGSNGVPSMVASAGSAPVLGGTFSMDLANMPLPSSPVFIVFGLSTQQMSNGVPLPLDLAVIGAPGCNVLVDPAVSGGTGSSNGTGVFMMPIPLDPSLTGLIVYFQGLTFDPASNLLGLTTTNGVLAYLGT